MAGRSRGAIALLVALCCASGCISWRQLRDTSSKELGSERTGFQPLDQLQISAAVGAGGSVLLEIRRMCKATETVRRQATVTERAGVGKTPVILAVGGFVVGAIGAGAGIAQNESGAVGVSIAGGVLLAAPLVYALIKRGATRTRDVETRDTRQVEAVCEDGFAAGTKVAVKTPWGVVIDSELSDEGMAVVPANWKNEHLGAGETWVVTVEGASGNWAPDEAAVVKMLAPGPGKTKKPKQKRR